MYTMKPTAQFADYAKILQQQPDAVAIMRGSQKYPDLYGEVWLYQLKHGVLVAAEINGLPKQSGPCGSRIFGFHIHDGMSCGQTQPGLQNRMNAGQYTGRNRTMLNSDPFPLAMMHYNPSGCEHPQHAGDLPPLFGNNGYALSIFLTDRFITADVIGKTVIIHDRPDDFKTQPAGDAGEKIACGEIQSF